jgi:IS5 family transposase
MRERHDLLAAIARLAASGGMAATASRAAATTAGRWAHRLDAGIAGQRQRTGSRGGEQTGKDPTNRGKLGTKRHVVVERTGLPLSIILSATNVHDSKALEEVVDALPPLRQPHHRRGRPRQRPNKLHADKGYDYPRCRRVLRSRGIIPRIARRGIESHERLGRYRWVVERTLSWLNRFRRLKVRYERRADIHQALLTLGCALICARALPQVTTRDPARAERRGRTG